MAFEFRKISDVGTSHPVVARLGSQTVEVLNWLDTDKANKNAIVELYLEILTQRLLRCHKIRNDLVDKVDDALHKYAEQKDARTREVPHVIGLQELAEEFLYQAKNFLRDLLKLFRITYDCELKDASAFADLKNKGDSDVVKWGIATFGPDHELTRVLRTEQEWAGEIIRMRNAVEHPGGHSGNLTLLNIRVQPNGYIPPTWELTGRVESSILCDMDTELHNMLTLAEELLVHVVMHKTKFKEIAFYEIPLGKRRPECPIRFRVGFSPEMEARLGRASEESAG